jgi:hypothetical protein
MTYSVKLNYAMLLALVVTLGRRISAVLGRRSLNVAYCTSLKPTLIGTKRINIFYSYYYAVV